MSKNLFGALVAGGVVAMLMFQVFVNVGMTIGIMPVTGVTLPLMSYGGSSVLTTLLAVGLLQSIYVQARASAAHRRAACCVSTDKESNAPQLSLDRTLESPRQRTVRRRSEHAVAELRAGSCGATAICADVPHPTPKD